MLCFYKLGEYGPAHADIVAYWKNEDKCAALKGGRREAPEPLEKACRRRGARPKNERQGGEGGGFWGIGGQNSGDPAKQLDSAPNCAG